MKKVFFYVLMGVVFVFNVTSCGSDDQPAPIVLPVSTTAIISAMKEGSWQVTKYIDHTEVQTDHFTGYVFTFGEENVISATNGTDTVTGVWTVTNNSSSTDDSPTNPLDFNITFTTPADFEDISDDWDLISRTSTKLELIDVSGGSSNTDYITFEKVL